MKRVVIDAPEGLARRPPVVNKSTVISPPRHPAGRGSAHRHTGRARQRRNKRYWIIQRALLALVASCKLASQSPTFRKFSPPGAFARLVQKSFRLAKSFPFTQTQSHTTNIDDFDLPSWATRLYRATNLFRSVPISRAWNQFIADSQSYAARCSTSSIGAANSTATETPQGSPGTPPPEARSTNCKHARSCFLWLCHFQYSGPIDGRTHRRQFGISP
jgi:hypothetical protein